VHVTRAYDTKTNVRTNADPHQSFIITDENNRLASTDDDVSAGDIYVYAISKIIAQSDGAITYASERFQDVIVNDDIVIGNTTAYNELNIYGTTDAYIQFTNSSTGHSATTDGVYLGIDSNDDFIIENQEYTGEINLKTDEGYLTYTNAANKMLEIGADYHQVKTSGTERTFTDDNGLFVNNGGMRISSGATYTDPGDGNLYVEGTITAATVDLNGGSIDGTVIGGTTPAAGAFTTLSCSGNATIGNASGDAHTVNGTLTVDPGTQAYKFSNRSDRLTIQSQTPNTDANVELFTADGDCADNVYFLLWGLGTPDNLTNAEYMVIGAQSDGSDITSFNIYSRSFGTGSDRKLRLAAGLGNLGMLDLETDGNVSMSGDLTANSFSSGDESFTYDEAEASVDMRATSIGDVDESFTLEYSIIGNIVTVSIPDIDFSAGGYSNMTLKILTIPSAIRPTTTKYIPIFGLDGGAAIRATLEITGSSEDWDLIKNEPDDVKNNWDDTGGNIGMYGTSFSYRLD